MKLDRFKLGILFNFDPIWMGGLIYILNSIKILNFLEDQDKPIVVVFFDKRVEEYVNQIDYPYLEKVPNIYPSIYKGYLSSLLNNKNVFVHDLIESHRLNAIFPMHDYPVKSKLDAKLVSWYADLQHKYYPNFFTKKRLLERNIRINLILKNSKQLVVSSQAVKDDFLNFYKVPKSIKIHIYHFVSIIDNLPMLNSDEIQSKYNLPEKYFIVSNQFQKHKNHIVVFKALAELQKKGVPIHVAITGRFPSDPNSLYMKELHDIVNLNKLKNSISFLGLIPRGDQLLLIKNAVAVIQPSLFEGWSTVIEDAKSFQVPVIASKLDVNVEQLGEKGTYFDPHNHHDLASILENYPLIDQPKTLYEPYENRMKNAAYEFLAVFK